MPPYPNSGKIPNEHFRRFSKGFKMMPTNQKASFFWSLLSEHFVEHVYGTLKSVECSANTNDTSELIFLNPSPATTVTVEGVSGRSIDGGAVPVVLSTPTSDAASSATATSFVPTEYSNTICETPQVNNTMIHERGLIRKRIHPS